MAKSNLEQTVNSAAEKFAREIIAAVKSATLMELIALQEGGKPKRRGRKPGPKPGKKKNGVKKTATKKTTAKKAATKKTAAKKTTATASAKKKRVVKNYPKCAYPKCTKNRFPRGKGFCGDHWKQFEAGKIKSADSYKKKGAKK